MATTEPLAVSVIDISHWQRIPRFALVSAAGVRKVILRLGDGTAMDPYFVPNLESGARHLEVGEAYWEFRPSLDPDIAAEIVMVMLASTHFSVSVLWLAMELSDHLSARTVNDRACTFLPILRDELSDYPQVRLGVYTRQEWWNYYMRRGGPWAELPLWIADYGFNRKRPVLPPQPRVPRDWQGRPWHRWQVWPFGKCPGVTASVDLNREPILG